ncbi:hypothetical protein M0802_008747 [Mischocyttarus mexicanus]|nr:hypothetical protein M0802_008747 [Mischocyttarus mexicanus]
MSSLLRSNGQFPSILPHSHPQFFSFSSSLNDDDDDDDEDNDNSISFIQLYTETTTDVRTISESGTFNSL